MLASLSRAQNALLSGGLQAVGNKGFFRKISGNPKPLNLLGVRRRQVSFSQTVFVWSARTPSHDLSLGPIRPRKTAGRRNPEISVRYSAVIYNGLQASDW